MSDDSTSSGTAREAILERIRAAQRIPTSTAVRHGVGPPNRQTQTAGLPYVPPDPAAMRAAFATRCAALKAELVMVESRGALAGALGDVLAMDPSATIAVAGHPLVDPLLAALGRPVCVVNTQTDRAQLAGCSVGITSCHALIAQTGSVVVTSQATGGRVLSILAPHHIVIATMEQLAPDLPAAYARFAADPARGTTSMLSIISGPSRTGDIERILVLGAHGPKRLTILLTP